MPEKLSSMVKSGESFEVIALGGNILEATKRIEHAIEAEGLRCRYTIGRVAAGGITALVGAGAIAGIMYHNLYTYNPDYKIGKDMDMVNNKWVVDSLNEFKVSLGGNIKFNMTIPYRKYM